jgi:hypothetical protein
MDWVRKKRFLHRKKIVEKNLVCCSLNKKIKLLNEKRIKSNFGIFLKIDILRFG